MGWANALVISHSTVLTPCCIYLISVFICFPFLTSSSLSLSAPNPSLNIFCHRLICFLFLFFGVRIAVWRSHLRCLSGRRKSWKFDLRVWGSDYRTALCVLEQRSIFHASVNVYCSYTNKWCINPSYVLLLGIISRSLSSTNHHETYDKNKNSGAPTPVWVHLHPSDLGAQHSYLYLNQTNTDTGDSVSTSISLIRGTHVFTRVQSQEPAFVRM